MPCFDEVTHRGRVAARVVTACAPFADPDHPIRRTMFPKLRFEALPRRAA